MRECVCVGGGGEESVGEELVSKWVSDNILSSPYPILSLNNHS